MSKVRWFTNRWFSVARIGFCPDVETWNLERDRWLHRTGVDLGDYPTGSVTGVTKHWHGSDDCLHIMIAVCIPISDRNFMPVLAHEAYHATRRVLEEMQEWSPGEETVAYMLTGIMDELLSDAVRVAERKPAKLRKNAS